MIIVGTAKIKYHEVRKRLKLATGLSTTHRQLIAGDVAFRFSDGVLKLWNRKNQNCRRGRPFVYGDTAIETPPTVAVSKQAKTVVSDIEADS